MVTVNVNGNNIREIELFVFDKDGTLIDLYIYWQHMVDLRAEGICSFYKLDALEYKDGLMYAMGVDIHNLRLRPEGPVGLLPRAVVQRAAEEYLEKLGCQDASNVCFHVFEEVDIISLSRLEEFMRPIPGAFELLRGLKRKGCKTAIATTDKTARAELAVKFLNIGDLIDFVVGADKVKEPKPAADMLEFIGNGLGIAPENSVMVGDAETDVRMGINAHFKASIGVYSGLTSKAVLSGLTPYVIEDISKIRIE